MKIYDISQELLTSAVYEGDPRPEARLICSIKDGEAYNLTALSFCAHNGTHIDAPCHFIDGGADVSDIPLDKAVGYARVVTAVGVITEDVAKDILFGARAADAESWRRLLIKGDAILDADAARFLAREGVVLVGTEGQSIGRYDAPMEVHLALLDAGVVILEGLRLNDVTEGEYLLAAQPISIKNADGAPCRAILITV